MLLTGWLRLLRARFAMLPKSRRMARPRFAAQKRRLPQSGLPDIEALEDRVMLSAFGPRTNLDDAPAAGGDSQGLYGTSLHTATCRFSLPFSTKGGRSHPSSDWATAV